MWRGELDMSTRVIQVVGGEAWEQTVEDEKT